MEVYVTTPLSPTGSFWVQLACEAEREEFHSMVEDLQRCCQEEPPTPVFFNPGDFCAARFSEDECWYRAKVEEIVKGEVGCYVGVGGCGWAVVWVWVGCCVDVVGYCVGVGGLCGCWWAVVWVGCYVGVGGLLCGCGWGMGGLLCGWGIVWVWVGCCVGVGGLLCVYGWAVVWVWVDCWWVIV